MNFDIRKLALDTLYNRSGESVEADKSCFVVNESGQMLRACGVEAIPILEELIREVVVPAMNEYREQTRVPDWNSVIREGPPFAGLSELIGAYWIICAGTEPTRAVSFIKTTTKPVITESVSRLAVFFNPNHRISDVELPREYVNYVNELNESDVGEFRAVALQVIAKLGLNESAAK